MNRSTELTLTPQESRARDLVRALAVPRAEPTFRERLRRQFVAGTIAAPAPRVVALPRRRATNLAWGMAAAAALVVVIAIANRGPVWSVERATGEGMAIVDDRPVPLAHPDELGQRLRRGARVQLPSGSTLEVTSPGVMALQITGGTDMTLPPLPGVWLRRSVRGEMRSGEIRIATGAHFRGARLDLVTPEAHVMVTGTTLAVICEPTGTCVCVDDGIVMVGEKAGEMVAVTKGHRRYVFNDGRPPESADIRPTERTELPVFRAREDATLGGRTPK